TLCVKHCDGVCNWPSTVTAGHTIYDSTGWVQLVERDLVQEFCDIADRRGKFKGFLLEVGDSWLKTTIDPDFGSAYQFYILGQMTELAAYRPDFIKLDAWGSF